MTQILDESFFSMFRIPVNSYLSQMVKEENLMLSGHYKVSNNHSTRDWINLEKLFSVKSQKFIDPVTQFLDNNILSKYQNKKTTLVGFNYYGAILAAILGYRFKYPFTYYFHESKHVDEIENELLSLESDHIVIIVDVLVNGETIIPLLDNLLEDYNNKPQIDLVVLFERT